MAISFHKYQGTGNDFVIIDQTKKRYINPQQQPLIEKLCDRRYGVGADGLMLIEASDRAAFKMVYFNSDGRLSSMCGNGGRCIGHLAHALKIVDSNEFDFEAVDGFHKVRVLDDGVHVELQMNDVTHIECSADRCIMDTGSPHFVAFVEDVTDIDVYKQGRAIRYSSEFFREGINVNFVECVSKGKIKMATYERGVEAETLSCGTGVTAAALAYAQREGGSLSSVSVDTKGGRLFVTFSKNERGHYTDIWLKGPVQETFRGSIDL